MKNVHVHIEVEELSEHTSSAQSVRHPSASRPLMLGNFLVLKKRCVVNM